MVIDFKFEIDRKVNVEKLGLTGIVSMCALDDGGKTYYVKTIEGGSWFPERLLTGAEAGRR